MIKDLRNVYKDMDAVITQTEKLLEEGLPLCDFKVYRSGPKKNYKQLFKIVSKRIQKLN